MTRLACLPLALLAWAALTAGTPEPTPLPDGVREAVARGDLKQAERLLADSPVSPDAPRILGDLLSAAGRTEASLPYYREALRDRPGDAEISLSLGRALTGLGRAAEAAEILEGAGRVDHAELHRALGFARASSGDVVGGLASLRRARDLRQGESSARAGELYDYYLERHGDELSRALAEGEQAREDGDFERAARLLLGYAMATGGPPESAVAGARSALAAGLPAEVALDGFLFALELDPDPALGAEALAGCGAASLRLGEAEAAAEHFRGALDLDPDRAEALFGASLAEARAGRFSAAAGLLERALAAADETEREAFLRFARSEPTLSGRKADPRLRELVGAR